MRTRRAAGIMAVLAVMLSGCEEAAEPLTQQEARPVDVQVVSTAPLTLSVELPGRVEPMRTAEVRARVAGIVLHKRFEEGADVKAGDLLFQIDPAPLRAAVARAEATLAGAQASAYEAQARLKRYASLVDIEAISRQDFDSATASLRSAQAGVRSAEADLQSARLNLGYASVKAPISGRIGRALVSEGALVGQDEATLMAHIQQLDPVYVDFTQPVADALRLRAALQEGLPDESGQALSLRVEGTAYERRGTLLFTDVSVDRGTGQVLLRGQFANPDALLLPGMYVRVSAPQARVAEAIVLPQRAVQRSADGSAHVLLVDDDSRVEWRPVQTGAMQGARWQITQGLAPGERVIVGGLGGLQPGMPVEVRPSQEQQQATRP